MFENKRHKKYNLNLKLALSYKYIWYNVIHLILPTSFSEFDVTDNASSLSDYHYWE